MNGPRKFLLIVTSLLTFAPLMFSSATNIYITQDGSSQGACTASPHNAAWFNSSSNWGGGTSQIGPGTTVLLCGTISSTLTAQGSGASGSPVTILFDTGASITTTCNGGSCLAVTNKSYVIVDGGVPCGWINQVLVPCNGTVQSSAAQPSGSQFGIDASSCSNCEFRNLNIGPIYTKSSGGNEPVGDIRGIQTLPSSGNGTWLIHNNIIHDTSSAIVYVPNGSNDNGFQAYNNVTYNINSSVDISNNNNGTLTAASIHDNHFGATGNWDNSGCPDHHNSLHAFAYTTTNSGIDYYNNLIDGDWGNCPTSGLFIEGNGSVNQNVRVFNNLWLMTYQQENNGIVSITAGGYVRFYNNTVIGANSSDTCVGVTGNAGATVYIENNIISNCTTLFAPSSLTGYTTVDNNIYGGNNTNPWTDQSIPAWYPTLALWQAHCKCDTHSSYGASASWVKVNSGGTLEAGSPAIAEGADLTSLSIPALDSDIAGIGRPGGSSPWDAGAYDSTTNPPPAPPTGLAAQVQ